VLKYWWSIRNTPLREAVNDETGDVPCIGLQDPCDGGDTPTHFFL